MAGLISEASHHDILRDGDISWAGKGGGQWGVGSGEWGMESGEWGVGSCSGEGSGEGNFLFPTPHSPLPIPEILSPKLLMKTGVGSFYPCLNAGPYCGALIVPGLCGGAINPYNGASNFVAAY